MADVLYDQIGRSYSRSRRADARIVSELVRLLDLPLNSILADIGAGTGNYTRALAEYGFHMIAVEPSATMRTQAKPHPNVRWLEGIAESLPIADNSVDGVVSTLALHHFTDLAKSFREMARVARSAPIVLFTFDTLATNASSPWMRDYWPTVYCDESHVFPPLADIARLACDTTVRTAELQPFLVPPDIADLFMASGWRRPKLYLDAQVRAGISSFARANPEAIAQGVEQLQVDLESGAWEEKYGAILQAETFDAGYRFLILR